MLFIIKSKEYGTYQNLPCIFINEYYIGSIKDFELLEENGYINQILNKGNLTLFILLFYLIKSTKKNVWTV